MLLAMIALPHSGQLIFIYIFPYAPIIALTVANASHTELTATRTVITIASSVCSFRRTVSLCLARVLFILDTPVWFLRLGL
jgi:hypothetical protein